MSFTRVTETLITAKNQLCLAISPEAVPTASLIENCLLNDPIRSRQHIGRNRETDLLGGLKVDDQLEFGWLLNGKIRRFRSCQDFVDVDSYTIELVGKVRA